MKKVFLALMLMTAFACSDDDGQTQAALTSDEAADMVATSISLSAGGMTTMLEEVSVTTSANAGGRVSECGYSEQMDISKSSPEGASVSYDYTYHYDFAIVCAQAIPSSMIVNVDYEGWLNGPRLSTENDGSANLSVEALDASYSSFAVNGSYSRSGSFVSKVQNQNSSTSTITLMLDDIGIEKEGSHISGGSASVTINGTVSGKGEFSFVGSIVFNGNGLAEFDIDGTKYSIDVAAGTVTKL